MLKWIALEGYSLKIIGGITFRFLANRGATFGVSVPYIDIISLIVLLLLSIYAYKYPSCGLSLILLGGFSNVLDRLVYGYVIDYLHIPFLPIVGHTYFNLADVMIDVGVILLAWQIIKT
ncbi:MAG: signal peptidase II [Dictyoglomi bacterium]|nr:signal peptidase II [Dictyoglomota bacterium]